MYRGLVVFERRQHRAAKDVLQRGARDVASDANAMRSEDRRPNKEPKGPLSAVRGCSENTDVDSAALPLIVGEGAGRGLWRTHCACSGDTLVAVRTMAAGMPPQHAKACATMANSDAGRPYRCF